MLICERNYLIIALWFLICIIATSFKTFAFTGAVKFFGSIARTLPEEILMRYSDFVEFIFSRANGEDPVLMVLCIETITNICSAEKGLKILYQNPEKLNNVMQIIAKVIQSSLDEVLKLRVLDSLSSLFEESQDGNSADNSLIKESLYKHLGQNPIEVLMNSSKQPFPDVRNGSFKVLASISRYSWSEQDMALAPGKKVLMVSPTYTECVCMYRAETA